MIKKGAKSISSIMKGNKAIQFIYKGTLLVYQAIKNFFASGVFPLILTNTVGSDLTDYKIEGNSVQKSKNLVGYNNRLPYSNGGVEITKTSKGYKIYGTTTGYPFVAIYTIPAGTLNGTYTLSTNVISGSSEIPNVRVIDRTNGASNVIATKSTDNITFSIDNTHNDLLVEIACNINKNYDIEFNIQLETGEVATDYVSHLPTPETPIEVESVGVSTKNLFDINNTDNWLRDQGMTYFYYGIYVGANNTVTISWDNNLELNQQFYVNIANTSSKKGTSSGAWLYHSTVSDLCVKNRTVTADEEGYIYINCSSLLHATNKLQKLQVEYGTTVSEYEPYGYKIPVKASVENEFNYDILNTRVYEIADKKVTVRSSNTTGWANMETLTLKPNAQYCLITDNETDIDIRTPTNVRLYRGTTTKAYFATDDTGLACFKFFNANNIYPHYIGYIYLCELSQEPITTNIYLDEPLRKVRDYADYIDFGKQKVVRNVGAITLNGTENWGGTGSYYTGIKGKAKTVYVLSSMLPYAISGQNRITGTTTNNAIDCFVAQTYSMEEWKTLLAEKNMEVLYQLDTPTEETIELPSIPTLKGTTILDIDVTVEPSYVEVEYTSAKSKESVPLTLANGDTLLDSNGDYFNVKEE